jgi:membrane-associated phospholipid phosphatase
MTRPNVLAPYETPLLLAVWGFAVAFWLWASGLDVTIQTWLYANYHQNFNSIMRVISSLALGRTQVWGVVLLAVGLYIWARWRGVRPVLAGQVAWVLPVLASAGVLQLALKILIGRPRPKELLWNDVPATAVQPLALDSSWWSLPSGHATSTCVVLVWLGLVFPRVRYGLWAVAGVLCASRFLAITPHYVGDVVAGAALGTALALAGWHVTARWRG